MIGKLTGTVDSLTISECILDVSGVGYHLYIPFTTYEALKAGEKASLKVYTIHKDDQFKLYGFCTETERDFFALLLNISGVGPAMGLAVLSGMSVNKFAAAVADGNSESLTRIPGIGKGKAEKIIFEAKRMSKKLEALSSDMPKEASARSDSIEALTALGFEEKRAVSAVDTVLVDTVLKEDISAPVERIVERIVKEALRLLSA